MTGQHDAETLTAATNAGAEENAKSSGNKIDIALTAKMNGTNKIDIVGPPGPFPLGVDTHAWRFNFTLNDTTGKGVRFTTLDAEDHCSSCPPTVTGNQSSLIVGVQVEPHDPTEAHFIDNNNNKAKDGVVNVSFQWHFACNDPAITHIDTYDPVVPNGGRT